MKRDMDLIRTLLLEIESWPPGARVPSTRIVIAPYTEEQIRYHAELLHDAGFIGGVLAVHRASGERPAIVGRLTWHGHEFVDATRSDIVWAAVKQRADTVEHGGSPWRGVQESLARFGVARIDLRQVIRPRPGPDRPAPRGPA